MSASLRVPVLLSATPLRLSPEPSPLRKQATVRSLLGTFSTESKPSQCRQVVEEAAEVAFFRDSPGPSILDVPDRS